MKIKNVKKFIRSIMLVLLVIFFLSLFIVKSALSYTTREYTTIYVKSGDTFWSIATDLQKNNCYYKGKDVRYIIGDLKEINGLKSSTLCINQEIQIPII